MPQLASLVKDNYGNIIGRALSQEELKKTKIQSKAQIEKTQNPLHSNYEFKDYSFVDTIKKKIIRKIFEITKDA